MTIITYNSTAYKNTTIYTGVTSINAALPPDMMTDDDRESLRRGDMEFECNFTTGDGVGHVIPWSFIIEINEEE